MHFYFFFNFEGTRHISAGEEPIVEQVTSDGRIEWAKHESLTQKELFDVLSALSPKVKRVPCPTGGKTPRIGYGDDIIILIKNVVFMGNNHDSDEKRIEIPSKYKEIYEAAKAQGKKVVIVGYYRYKDNVVYAVFNTEDYMAHEKVHQSAGWVYTSDIAEATVNGYFERIDRKGNRLYVMNEGTFADYLGRLAAERELPVAEEERRIKEYLADFFVGMPKDLLGIQCYEEMRDAKYSQWRQSRWEGWYPEFLLQAHLKANPTESIVWWGKKGVGEIDLDMKFPRIDNFYGDAKSDNEDGETQGNKKETIETVINAGGKVWYVVFQWTKESDVDHGGVTTKWWNTALNDPAERVPGRPKPLDTFLNQMKFSVHITRMEIYEIDSITFPFMKEYLPTPCGGRERAPKVEIAKRDRDRFRIFAKEA